MTDVHQINYAMAYFIQDHLPDGHQSSIFDPIKKHKLPTFESLAQKKVIKTKTKVVSLQSAKDLFAKVAIIAQKRVVNLKQLLSYPLFICHSLWPNLMLL